MQRVAFKMKMLPGMKAEYKKWWAYMADIMETNPDNSPITVSLEEVFYLA